MVFDDDENDVYNCITCQKQVTYSQTDEFENTWQGCDECFAIFCPECLHICAGKDCETLLCKPDYDKNNGLCQICVSKK